MILQRSICERFHSSSREGVGRWFRMGTLALTNLDLGMVFQYIAHTLQRHEHDEDGNEHDEIVRHEMKWRCTTWGTISSCHFRRPHPSGAAQIRCPPVPVRDCG